MRLLRLLGLTAQRTRPNRIKLLAIRFYRVIGVVDGEATAALNEGLHDGAFGLYQVVEVVGGREGRYRFTPR